MKMGISEISLWVLIRRYDQLQSGSDLSDLETSLRRVTLPSGSTFDELKLTIYNWIGEEENPSRVLKIRRHDNNLIPVSSLLTGSSKDKHFFIDLVRVHQFCPVEKRTIPLGYVDALKSKLTNIESRVRPHKIKFKDLLTKNPDVLRFKFHETRTMIEAEDSLPQVASAHIQAVKGAASQLANCVAFLDRRVDELVPPQWKDQLNSVAS